MSGENREEEYGCQEQVQFGFNPESVQRSSHFYQPLVTIPAAEVAGKRVRLRFSIVATNPFGLPDILHDASMSLMFFKDVTADRPPVSEAFLRHNVFFGHENRNICLIIDVPVDACTLTVLSYTDRKVPLGWQLQGVHILDGADMLIVRNEALVRKPLSFAKKWVQKGNRITVTWLGSTFFADMPQGFNLETVPQDKMNVVNDLLFGNLEHLVFGQDRLLTSKDLRQAGNFGRSAGFSTRKVLLCYSGGEDSTAALRLLPSHLTQPFFSKRSYSSYFTPNGARVRLNQPVNEERALARVPTAICTLTNFESIGLTVGTRHGYQDNFGYAALGVLLASHFDANVVAFGSVMEQIFMKSGYDFTDAVFYRPSRYNKYLNLFASVDLFFGLPTGVMSEVITNRICGLSRDKYLAVPCPNTSVAGEPCGRCFKCFRKLRLEERTNLPPPEQSVIDILKKRPLKSATSLVYSVQKSGYEGDEINEYLSADVDFLDRYFGSYLPLLIPQDIANHIARELADMNISPMTPEDEHKLRTVAKIFAPESWSEKRAFPLKEQCN